MNICVLDDSLSGRLWIQQQLEAYTEKIGQKMNLTIFETGKELMAYEGTPFDAAFLDIELNDKQNGIDIARWINSKWKSCQVVFLSNYTSFAMDVYEAEHTYYVQKEKFPDYIGRVFAKLIGGMQGRTYNFEIIGKDTSLLNLAEDDVLYFERNGRKTRVATAWGDYMIWESIGDLCEKMNKSRFLRCHTSYLVNMSEIKQLGKDSLLMSDGAEISVSRRYRKQVFERYSEWLLNKVI